MLEQRYAFLLSRMVFQVHLGLNGGMTYWVLDDEVLQSIMFRKYSRLWMEMERLI